MSKTVLMMLLVIVGNNTMADWVAIGTNANFTSYADPTSIRPSGNKAKMLSLIDNKTSLIIAGQPYTSVKTQHEFDCRTEQARRLSSTIYSGHMGSGDVVQSKFSADDWAPVPTRNLLEILWKLACGKS